MSDCLFCGMVDRSVNAEIVHETEEILAFRDINPQAPTHILIIPKAHIASINEAGSEQAALLGRLVLAAQTVAGKEGIAEDGYRLVFNCGGHGQQTVFHIHLHLVGGRQMSWPPG